jgi:hypothetical protein
VQTLRNPTPSLPATTRVARAALVTAAALGAQAYAQPIGGDAIAAGSAVAAIVKVPKPWYAPRFVVVGKMRDTMAQYQALPGLAFKAYSFAQADGHFGGIYLWNDLASARAWFSPAWFTRIEHERGAAGEVRFFEVLAAIDNTPGGTAVDADSSSVATLSISPLPAGADRQLLTQQLQAALVADRQVPGLLRRYFVLADQGRPGQISLWRDAASARRWFNGAGAVTARSSQADPTLEWFDTPILLPSTLPANRPRIAGL